MRNYGIDTRRRKNRFSVEFDDQVSRILENFGSDQAVVARVVGAAAHRLKLYARVVHRRTFRQHSGSYLRSIWYKQGKKSARATLYAGNLSSIYERAGALVQPMKGRALKFEIDGRTVFYTGVLRIEARPWFLQAMRDAESRGYVKQAAMKQIEWEIKEAHLG
jgi:hypothetical protein